jgi:hypothetical protein
MTMVVKSIAPARSRVLTIVATCARFCPMPLLVDDRVNRDGALAGLAVADDELALAAADGNHRVNRLDPRLERRVHGLARGDVRGNDFDGAVLLGRDGAAPVHWLAERVDDTPDEGLPDGHGDNPPGALDGVPFFDGVGSGEEDDPDFFGGEVKRQTVNRIAVVTGRWKLDQLLRHHIVQPGNARDAVADLKHLANVDGFNAGRFKCFNLLAQKGGNIFNPQCHGACPFWF